MVLTFAMTLSMASIATIQAMQSPIEFNKSKTYAVISKTNNKPSPPRHTPGDGSEWLCLLECIGLFTRVER